MNEQARQEPTAGWHVGKSRQTAPQHLRLIGALVLAALAAMLALLVANAHRSALEREQTEGIYVHTLSVLLATSELKSAVQALARGERGFLLTSDAGYLSRYRETRAAVPGLARHLRSLMRDNPRQQSNLDVVDRHLRSQIATIDRNISLARGGHIPQAINAMRSDGRRLQTEHMLGAFGPIEAEERRLLALRKAATDRANRRTERFGYGLASAGGLLLLIATGAGLFAVRAYEQALDARRVLHLLATTDMLTGLANRRKFLAELDEAVARAAAAGTALSVAVLDVDHFKRVNDMYGHPVGDEVLRNVAMVLSDATRAGDVVGRIGGEEFAILLPGTSGRDAAAICERLREAVARHPIRLESGVMVLVTISIGVAQMAHRDAAARLIARADKALYAVKNGGRNGVRRAI